jgi:hypothetical protein
MLGFLIFIFWGVYVFFCEFGTIDLSQIPETELDKDTKRFIICFVLSFAFCVFLYHYSGIDSSGSDFQDFKDLMKEHGLKWSDLFTYPDDKNKNK